MALTIATNPQTNETAVLVDGAWKTAEQVAVNPQDQSKAYFVDGKWLTDTGQAELPPPEKGVGQKMLEGAKAGVKEKIGGLEAATSLVTGAVATPLAGIAGIGRAGLNAAEGLLGLEQGPSPAQAVEEVQQGLTYQPRTQEGQAALAQAGAPLALLDKGADWLGQDAYQGAKRLGASDAVAAAVGSGVKTTAEVGPQVLLGKGAGMAREARVPAAVPRGAAPGATPGGAASIDPAAAQAAGATSAMGSDAVGAGGASARAAETATGRAQAYVGTLGLDWNDLSAQFKAKLTAIAQDAKALGRLSPEAVKRQAVLSRAGIDNPTRGAVTRDPLQQRAEQLVKATDAGGELRQLDLEHNATLLKGVEDLRAKVAGESLPTTGSKARGDLPVGRSVQVNAVRAKAAKVKAAADALYTKARKTEPDATAPADALYDLLEQKPHLQRLGWVSSWLKRGKVEMTEDAQPASLVLDADGNPATAATPKGKTRRELSMAELDDLRKEAVEIEAKGGTDAHYAGEVARTVDQVMENVPEAAKNWKAARDAWRAYKTEFADQGAVRGLAENKPHSNDRRVAIEETAKKTVTGDLEDLQKVKRTLLTGKDAAARQAGKIAWRDLKGWGLDYIRERMTKGPKNEAGDPHATWVGLKTALDDIGDENLDELYGPTVRKQLRNYQEAAEILWTEGSTRVKGSPTLDKVLTFLDRIGNVPGLHTAANVAGGLAKGAAKVTEVGAAGRETRAAMRTPIDEQLSETRRSVRKSQNLSNVRRFTRDTAPAAAAGEQKEGQ